VAVGSVSLAIGSVVVRGVAVMPVTIGGERLRIGAGAVLLRGATKGNKAHRLGGKTFSRD
jgi:hypothetical protein